MEANDIIDPIENLNTFGAYPFSTIIHFLIGAISGWLLICGRELCKWRVNGTSSSLMGMTILGLWMAYEFGEFARIHDAVDKDLANGLLGVFIGILVGKLIWTYGIAEIQREENDGEEDTS